MKIFLKDGVPVLGAKGGVMVDPENGSEPYEFDVIGVEPTLAATRAEAKKYRLEKAELKAIVDAIPEPVRANPKAAEEALVTVSSLGEKQKVEIEKVRTETEKAFEAKYKPVIDTLTTKSQTLTEALATEKITNRFATSPVLDKTIFHKTRNAAVKVWREFFNIDDDGKMVAKGKDGQPLYSKTNPGQLAEFDEALETIISTDPLKEAYMAPSGQTGTGHRQTGRTDDTGQPVGALNRIKAGLDARNK